MQRETAGDNTVLSWRHRQLVTPVPTVGTTVGGASSNCRWRQFNLRSYILTNARCDVLMVTCTRDRTILLSSLLSSPPLSRSLLFSLLFALRPEQPITISTSDPVHRQEYAARREQDSPRTSRLNPKTPVLNLMMKLARTNPQIEADLVVMSPPPTISLHGDESARLALLVKDSLESDQLVTQHINSSKLERDSIKDSHPGAFITNGVTGGNGKVESISAPSSQTQSRCRQTLTLARQIPPPAPSLSSPGRSDVRSVGASDITSSLSQSLPRAPAPASLLLGPDNSLGTGIASSVWKCPRFPDGELFGPDESKSSSVWRQNVQIVERGENAKNWEGGAGGGGAGDESQAHDEIVCI